MIQKKYSVFVFGILALVVTCIAVLTGNFFTKKIQIQIGEVAKTTILAPFQVENEIATNRKKDLAEKDVKTQYKKDSKVQEKAIGEIEELFNYIESLKSNTTEKRTEEELIKSLNEHATIALYNEQYAALLHLSKERIAIMKKTCIDVASSLFDEGITQSTQNNSIALKTALETSTLTVTQQKIAQDIIISVLEPNVIVDELATNEAIRVAREKVEPVYVLAGEKIIEQGTKVTEETYMLLEKVGYLNTDKSVKYQQYLGFVILLVLGSLFVFIYICTHHKKWSYSQYNFLFIIYTATILMVRTMMTMSFVYLPVCMATMLVAFAMEMELALLMHGLIVIFSAIILKSDFVTISYFMITGIGAIFVVRNMFERAKTVMNALTIGAIQVITYVSLKLFSGASLDITMGTECIVAFIMGVIAVVLIVGILPFLESAFGFITSMQLLELTNPNQPVLKRLLLEATGTYYHSLLVANLAEAAADAIGANPLMARVGGYYHDIGKLSNSGYFKENQGKENPHDTLTPQQSYKYIVAHVSEGVTLAKQYNLPAYIIDIIKQHHGTSCMQYFYVKAKEIDANVEESAFCYLGPKPRSKEAALVMLADVVEATVRAMQDRLSENLTIQDLVTKMVKQKLKEGQLDECELYISDIDKIIASFTKMLKSMYHERIKYPERTEQ
ncbi:HD family phosphohydrolase [Cellulosilyticum ruminicola]|uniref:HD family phosphohydrolase n=1 Tax=Cellulosilyticum ruminicola TaxID=425254 RepID=UPI0006D03741|nr:HDIG domain-containing metalloprotein [Cellulosilyticum ruminicola]